MIEAIRDSFTYGYGQVSYAASSVGSLTVSTGRKAVTLLTSATQQVSSVIYRVYSIAYHAIAYIVSYLFSKTVNGKILQNMQDQLPGLICSQVCLGPYVKKGDNIRFQMIRQVDYISEQNRLAGFFEVTFKVNQKTYCALLAVGADKASGVKQPVKFETMLIYLMDGQEAISLQLFTDIMNSMLMTPHEKITNLFEARKYILHIHTEPGPQPNARHQVWTFHTSEEDVSINVLLTEDNEGGAFFSIPWGSIKIVSHPSP